MIRLDHVSFQYQGGTTPPEDGQPEAIRQLSLTIEQGEYVTIAGPNGSGKSTLAKLMNGLLLPQAGNVFVGKWNTRDEQDKWDIRRRVGLVFQNPDHQMVATTVLDDVAFGMENLGIARDQMHKRAEQALRKVRMWEHRLKQPHHLSGGEKQRVAIAGILAMEPEVMIFDEPTSMFDPDGKRDILHIMRMLHEEGFTIIHITHDMEEVLQSTRFIVMHRGKIVADGRPAEILSDAAMLAQYQLLPPFIIEAKETFRKYGLFLPDRMDNERELVEELWTFISAT